MENKCKFEVIGVSLLLALLIPGSCPAQTKTPEKHKTQAAASNPHTVVLSSSAGKVLFPDGTKFWTPKPADIAHLETDLLKLAKNTVVPNPLGKAAPPGILTYYRQYIGIVQDGKRVIYVNAFASSMAAEFPNWRHEAYIVSDGGTGFYHVHYDVKARHFDTLQFNGYA